MSEIKIVIYLLLLSAPTYLEENRKRLKIKFDRCQVGLMICLLRFVTSFTTHPFPSAPLLNIIDLYFQSKIHPTDCEAFGKDLYGSMMRRMIAVVDQFLGESEKC